MSETEPQPIEPDTSTEHKIEGGKSKRDSAVVIPSDPETSSEEQEGTGEEDSTEDEEKEPETRSGMAIRLDLNLIVEIFLKAKIQGDVTITFL